MRRNLEDLCLALFLIGIFGILIWGFQIFLNSIFGAQ